MLFVPHGNFPDIIPMNFTPLSVTACMQLMVHVRRVGVKTHHDTSVVDNLLAKIDPVCADGKMRKDRSIDFTLKLEEYYFLAHNVEFFADHKVHHSPNGYVECKAMHSLMQDVAFAGVLASLKVEFSS